MEEEKKYPPTDFCWIKHHLFGIEAKENTTEPKISFGIFDVYKDINGFDSKLGLSLMFSNGSSGLNGQKLVDKLFFGTGLTYCHILLIIHYLDKKNGEPRIVYAILENDCLTVHDKNSIYRISVDRFCEIQTSVIYSVSMIIKNNETWDKQEYASKEDIAEIVKQKKLATNPILDHNLKILGKRRSSKKAKNEKKNV